MPRSPLHRALIVVLAFGFVAAVGYTTGGAVARTHFSESDRVPAALPSEHTPPPSLRTAPPRSGPEPTDTTPLPAAPLPMPAATGAPTLR